MVTLTVFKQTLGFILGSGSDIGGVGFGMLLLLWVCNSKIFSTLRTESFSKAIRFWQKMFIPIVIAMAASQNVFQALSSGEIAILAGFVPVSVSFLLLSVASRVLKNDSAQKGEPKHE